uniref:GIY endonuclease n=1 Tax=Leucoagaricus naucinus TaxID=34434 RepID=A0A8F5GFN3_9AGAR|nr:GIY endonuclease [Leucoagaricus naucinus]
MIVLSNYVFYIEVINLDYIFINNLNLDHSIVLASTLINIKPFGPHISPKFLNNPVRVYKPKLDRNKIGIENKGRTIIYQWINLINGKIYVGSAWSGSRRLLSYWTPSTLNRNYHIHNSINKYTHNNFMLVILEDLGETGSIDKNFMLLREQLYLNILFNSYPLLNLNKCPIAGTTLGFKHSSDFSIKRSGNLNPMWSKEFSSEYLYMQNLDKKGINNPMYGKQKSTTTIAKLAKLIYVYKSSDFSFIGVYPTVECSKTFKIGNDTLKKYLNLKIPYKGKFYTRTKIHN